MGNSVLASCNSVRNPEEEERPKSDICTLSDLIITHNEERMTYEPAFDASQIHYFLNLRNKVKHLIVSPLPTDKKATVALLQAGVAVEEKRDEWLYKELFPEAAQPLPEVPSVEELVSGLNADESSSASDKPDEDDDEEWEVVVDDGGNPVLGPDGQPRRRKKLPVLHSFPIASLEEGHNDFEVVVTAESGVTQSYSIVVNRKPWEPDEFKKYDDGTNYAKYLHYHFGAQQGNAEAQYLLALMYAGEDGFVEEKVTDADGNEVLKRVDPAVGNLHHFKWMLHAAENGFVPAQYRLGNMYFNGDVKPQWFRAMVNTSAEEEKKMEERTQDLEEAEASDLDEEDIAPRMSRSKSQWDEIALKLEAARWYQAAAEQGDSQSAYQLALMFVDGVGVKKNLNTALHWLDLSGMAKQYAKKQRKLAAGGDKDASLRLGQMYLDGIGVTMNFEKAQEFLMKGGKSKIAAKKAIRAKFQNLKPFYKSLFKVYDQDKDGEIDRHDFEGFYRDTLLAKGMSKEAADAETISTYQGRQKSDVVFIAFDVDRSATISFEEIWRHPHTSSLLPINETQLMAADKFFKTWNLAQGNTKTKPTQKGLKKVLKKRSLSTAALGDITLAQDALEPSGAGWAFQLQEVEESEAAEEAAKEDQSPSAPPRSSSLHIIKAQHGLPAKRLPTDFREFVGHV